MTHTMTRATLSEHYKAIRTRLNQAPARPTIRIEAPVTQTLPVIPEPAPVIILPEPKPLPKTSPRFRAIMHGVSERHGVSPHDIIGPCRTPRFVRARQELCYLLRQAGYSYPQIGEFCGNRDHTTVMHGVQQHEKRIREGKL